MHHFWNYILKIFEVFSNPQTQTNSTWPCLHIRDQKNTKKSLYLEGIIAGYLWKTKKNTNLEVNHSFPVAFNPPLSSHFQIDTHTFDGSATDESSAPRPSFLASATPARYEWLQHHKDQHRPSARSTPVQYKKKLGAQILRLGRGKNTWNKHDVFLYIVNMKVNLQGRLCLLKVYWSKSHVQQYWHGCWVVAIPFENLQISSSFSLQSQYVRIISILWTRPESFPIKIRKLSTATPEFSPQKAHSDRAEPPQPLTFNPDAALKMLANFLSFGSCQNGMKVTSRKAQSFECKIRSIYSCQHSMLVWGTVHIQARELRVNGFRCGQILRCTENGFAKFCSSNKYPIVTVGMIAILSDHLGSPASFSPEITRGPAMPSRENEASCELSQHADYNKRLASPWTEA